MPALAGRLPAIIVGVLIVACAGPGPSGAVAPSPTPVPTTRSVPSAVPSASASQSPSPTPDGTPQLGLAPLGPTTTAQVVDVVDGDTIKVEIGGAVFTVRYIGMDTPETVKPNTPVQWMGPEASAANKELVAGQQVVLEKDVSEVDRYGRLLRDVWLQRPDGWLFVNAELVRLGFASVATFPPDVAYVDVLLEAQREARAAGVGLWSATPPPSAAGSAGEGGCDPAYPTVCIPPPPPDLDCADITDRNFEVLPPDPHHFDGDHDGIGCES